MLREPGDQIDIGCGGHALDDAYEHDVHVSRDSLDARIGGVGEGDDRGREDGNREDIEGETESRGAAEEIGGECARMGSEEADDAIVDYDD